MHIRESIGESFWTNPINQKNTVLEISLLIMGVTTYIDSQHSIAHDKIIIIDKETVITGSFNFIKTV